MPNPAGRAPSTAVAAPLRIAFVGGGRIGSTFAYYLAKAGHDVTVVARPGSPRLAQLHHSGGIVLQSGERAVVAVTDQLDEAVEYDLIIVTMYDYQVSAVLPALNRSKARAIQFMFVTFDPERLAAAAGKERCSFGMPAVMARLDDQGRLGPTVNPRQRTLHGDRRWADLFTAAGIPSAFDPNMPQWLRCHVPLTAAMESICVAAARHGRVASWRDAMVVGRGLRAGYAIIRGSGWAVYPRSKRVISALPVVAVACLLRHMSSVRSLRELLAGGAREARAHIDSMATAGASATPPLPAAVKAVQAMRPAE